MAASDPYNLSSLIGGVSEQAPQDRTPSAAEAQENCLNLPLKGAVARAGSIVVGSGLEWSPVDPFWHVIQRSNDELYVVLVEGGQLHIVNLITGAICTKTNTAAINPYLTHTGPAREAFDAVTVEDTTFLVNRQRVPAMSSSKSPVRPNWALFYFKAAAYLTSYRAKITVGGITYTASYQTPDNSAPANAQYIATNELAYALHGALMTLKASTPTLASFNFYLSGSMVIVDGGAVPFDVDSEDGQGDTHLIAFKEWVKKFSDLPARCIDGYVVGVRGSASDQKADYWLKYYGSPTTGYWEEVVKPDTFVSLDAGTMPHILVNTAAETFNCVQPTWGTRLCGDGEKYAKDPTFVGQPIKAVNFLSGRLALITSGSFMLSRSRNAYSFFPDTAQTRLATDPVGYDIANGSVTVIQHSVAVSEKLFFWGDGTQIRHDTGDNAISEETSEALPATNYEFDGRVRPVPLGAGSVVFGTASGEGNTFLEVLYKSGVAIGELPLTDHCPNYVEGSLRGIFLGGSHKMMGALTDAQGGGFWLYQWLNQGDSRVQTSWNRWNLHGSSRVLAGAIRNSHIYLLVQVGSKLLVERIPVNPKSAVWGHIRLDHRVDETGATYDDAGVATKVLPYTVAEEDRDGFLAVENEDDDSGRLRGRPLDVEWVSGNTIKVACKLPNGKFFFGAAVVSRRRFSQPYIQTKAGTLLPDRCLITKIKVSHHSTTSYRCEVRGLDESLLVEHIFEGRRAISPETPSSKLPLQTGEIDFTVGANADRCWIDLINDTPYPSCWVGADIYYSVYK